MINQESQTPEIPVIIKVVGIGGGGVKAVNHMIDSGMQGVEFIAVGSDKQALLLSKAEKKIQIGEKLTVGLGMITANPEFGQKAAEEARAILTEQLRDADLVFIVTCLGGAVGTGAAPVVAECAREVGALTIGVVSKPFSFEGKRRMNLAEAGIINLKDHVDALIIISNDRLLQIADKKTNMKDIFHVSDDVMRKGIQGISDVLVVPGLLNADLEEIKAIMSNEQYSFMGTGTARGENGPENAAEAAIKSPLLEVNIEGAKSLLINITGGKDLSLYDVVDATNVITDGTNPDANIVFGAIIDNKMNNGEIQATVIAINCSEVPNKRKPDFKMGIIDYEREKRQSVRKTSSYGGDIPPWMLNCNNKPGESEGLEPRPDGKKLCNYLRKLRIELAQANKIPFETAKCTYIGPCAGTCPKCDKEASDLREKLKAIPEQERKYPQHNLDDWENVV